MKGAFLIGLMFLLLGCQTVRVPGTQDLRNENGQIVGRAVLVSDQYGLTADHIWRTRSELWLGDDLVEVAQRDRASDILVFTHAKNRTELVSWRKKLVETGETLFWSGGQAVVKKTGFQTEIETETLSDLIVLSGVINPGMSGAPVYDKKNRLIGIVLGGGDQQIFIRPISHTYLLDADQRASKIADEI